MRCALDASRRLHVRPLRFFDGLIASCACVMALELTPVAGQDLSWARADGGYCSERASKVSALQDGSTVVLGIHTSGGSFGRGEINEATRPTSCLNRFITRYSSDSSLQRVAGTTSTDTTSFGSWAVATSQDGATYVSGNARVTDDVEFIYVTGSTSSTDMSWDQPREDTRLV